MNHRAAIARYRDSISRSLPVQEAIALAARFLPPHATEGNQKKFQTQFAGGIAEEILGKDIDELSVSRVAGSSLTSSGFNDALEAIKAEAGGS